jgi:tetratricopeptide (TPR) repeat protein
MGITRWLAIAAVLGIAAAPAHAITEEEERAKAHFLAGQSYYDQASYTDALREFKEAYRLSNKPALLYNVARCYEGLEQFGDAVAMLERYLKEEPETPDREAVETRIAHLKEREAAATRVQRKPSEPTEPSRPPPVPPSATTSTPTAATVTTGTPPRKRKWTWIVGGVGVGLLAAALGTGVASQLTYNDLNNKCSGGHCDPTVVADAQHRIDRGKQLALATDVLWPIGAAAVATSIVLFIVEGRRPVAEKQARLVPLVSPSLGGLAVARDF